MAIYGRFGGVVTIERRAVLDDVMKFEKRRPDKTDKSAIAHGSYVIVRETDTGTHRLYHQAYLRADGGSVEITTAIEAVTPKGDR
jgi:hypothetical protein